MSVNIKELLKPGQVFVTSMDINPVRVIMSDGVSVFYEMWWPHCKDWSYKCSLRKSAIYYRTSVSNFLKDATYFITDQLAPEETSVHRPELPLHLCRNDQMKWTAVKYKSIEDFERQNHDVLQFTVSRCDLEINKIVLVPFGPKGGLKKGAVIEAKNGKSFSCIELLWNAQNLEAIHHPNSTEIGIGIFRQGFEKGIPSFYIGGFYDSAGILNEVVEKVDK